MAISHDEVDRILDSPAALRDRETRFYATDPAVQELSKEILIADEQAASDPNLRLLRQQFDLTPPECELLLLTAAIEVDPQLRRVYGYLNDDVSACYPTPLLAAQLFAWPAPVRFGPESGLVSWLLARPIDTGAAAWSLVAPWAVDAAVPQLLIDGVIIDPALGDAVRPHDRHLPMPAEQRTTEAGPSSLGAQKAPLQSFERCLYPAELDAMRDFMLAMRAEAPTRRARGLAAIRTHIEIVGPEGAGKRTLASQLCAALGAPLIVADAARLLGASVPPELAAERIVRAGRYARILGGLLYWHNAGAAQATAWDALAPFDEILLSAASPLPAVEGQTVARRTFRLAPLVQAQRKQLWESLSTAPVPTPVADWLLTPAQIVRAAAVAHAGPDAVMAACRRAPGETISASLTPLACPYTWDDMVMPAPVKQHLSELEAQTRLRWQVYEEWGFQRLCPNSRGITALFAGPSGTGKTMAAQVIARSLGMELYRVDLASVMSKYIGETEKNLKQIFDSCDRANVLLFFDEADALFGQRTQVKDAHDRFANIEIDYLLQRIEQFDGIAILATNRKGELDKAFLRRIRFIIDFVPPGPEERLAIWRRALPPRAPNGEELTEEIDFPLLAAKLTMTGADIKSAALAAAFLARAEGVRIGMRHVRHAARREMVKHGLLPRDTEI
jgi:AAA+ superfamily predicted ATPase